MSTRKQRSPVIRTRGRAPRPARPSRSIGCVLQLFVAGGESNSVQALENLVRLCDEHVKGRYEIHTVDVLEHADVAYRNNVIVTPTLILLRPLPKVTLYGNLRNAGPVLAALRLKEKR